jgi:nucleotide-binding universal stress UspA family protein
MKINKIKKVLIALDYNPTAQKVAETGFSFAKAMKAEIILLHVISDPVLYSSSEYSPIIGMSFGGFTNMDLLKLKTVEGRKKASKQFLNKSKLHLGDKSIKTLVKEGDFAEIIKETAEKLHVDIIVMGSHSRRWLENIVMGSVTEKVLHHTSIPLFIVPTKKK